MKHIVMLLISLTLTFNVLGQATTQTENWCPELGTIQSSRIILWGSNDLTRYTLSQDGIDLLQAFDTSHYVQAYYGDRTRNDDDYWVGAPRDLALYPYIYLRVQTSLGEREIGFTPSESEPDTLLGVALLSREVSGTGDQYGMHDICAVFMTTRAEVDALWNERVAVIKPVATFSYYPTLDPSQLPPTVTPIS